MLKTPEKIVARDHSTEVTIDGVTYNTFMVEHYFPDIKWVDERADMTLREQIDMQNARNVVNLDTFHVGMTSTCHDYDQFVTNMAHYRKVVTQDEGLAITHETETELFTAECGIKVIYSYDAELEARMAEGHRINQERRANMALRIAALRGA